MFTVVVDYRNNSFPQTTQFDATFRIVELEREALVFFGRFIVKNCDWNCFCHFTMFKFENTIFAYYD